MRSGLIATKVGMTCLYDENGVRIPVTVLDLGCCQVVSQRTLEKDGYTALQLGHGSAKPSRVSKPMKGHFAKNGLSAKQRLFEFKVSPENLIPIGSEFKVDHFVVGQYVDVAAVSIGKGFAGVMKRWGFAGLCASHGVSVSHRSQGSTGHRQEPSRVFKGKKMAGHLGAARVTVQGLRVVRTDVENGVLLVKGAVPGRRGCSVLLRDAVKRPLPVDVPISGSFQLPVPDIDVKEECDGSTC